MRLERGKVCIILQLNSICSFDRIFKTPQEMNLKISFLSIQIMESFLTMSLKMMKLSSPNHH